MPYHLELGSEGHSFHGKAIVVNSRTGEHKSAHPIDLADAKAQMRLLESKEHPASAGGGAGNSHPSAGGADAAVSYETYSDELSKYTKEIMFAALERAVKNAKDLEDKAEIEHNLFMLVSQRGSGGKGVGALTKDQIVSQVKIHKLHSLMGEILKIAKQIAPSFKEKRKEELAAEKAIKEKELAKAAALRAASETPEAKQKAKEEREAIKAGLAKRDAEIAAGKK